MFLQFYGITLTVKKWLHYTGVNVHETNPQPLMPFNIGLFLQSKKGTVILLLFHNEVDRTSPGYRGKCSSFKLFQESKTSFQNLFFEAYQN
jgi:hypothetical protein